MTLCLSVSYTHLINTDLDGLDTLCAFGGYAAGTKVGEAVPLFARIDSKKIMDELKAEMDAVKAKIDVYKRQELIEVISADIQRRKEES